MWPSDFWPDSYWDEGYWPKEGGEPPAAGTGDNSVGLGQKKTFSQQAELGGGSW